MILRLLIAAVGAVVVTGTLLLVMNQATALFRERNGQKYFLITDVLPAPERGRMQRPPAAVLPPERQRLDIGIERSDLEVELSSDLPGSISVDSRPALPELGPAEDD